LVEQIPVNNHMAVSHTVDQIGEMGREKHTTMDQGGGNFTNVIAANLICCFDLLHGTEQ